MTAQMRHPKALYKYRAFSNQTIDLLLSDKLFFADPSTFNDPLDTRPVVSGRDIPLAELEEAVCELVRRRVTEEMKGALRGPSSIKEQRHSAISKGSGSRKLTD
ncbi:hypothetical protein PO002_08645 [Cupriavidus necator]|uniref:hypothetical protein n=1 Tax=Cupriavidus necator TaxID=106590 RepID=UPI0039C2F039